MGLLSLLMGCQDQSYNEAITTHVWPATGEPVFRLHVGTAQQISVDDLRAARRYPVAAGAGKLSAPLLEQVRFSTDGTRLFVPYRKENLTDPDPQYRLLIWDLKKHELIEDVAFKPPR